MQLGSDTPHRLANTFHIVSIGSSSPAIILVVFDEQENIKTLVLLKMKLKLRRYFHKFLKISLYSKEMDDLKINTLE